MSATTELRSPRSDEAAAVAELFTTSWPDPVTESLIALVWSSPQIERELDSRVAEADHGSLVGYAEVELLGEDSRKLWVHVVGEPAAELTSWAEHRAAERVPTAARVFASAWSESEAVKRAFEARGFVLVRHSFRMAIDLPGADEPVWPEGIELRTFQPGDERAVYEVHQETFEDSWEHERTPYDEWAHWLLSPAFHVPDLWLLAEAGDELAGLALCWPDEAREHVGWVGILGVRRDWRRRGLGRALLLQAFAEFRGRGFRQVVLGVDAESLTGAHRLYESAGMRVVHRFDIYEKQVG